MPILERSCTYPSLHGRRSHSLLFEERRSFSAEYPLMLDSAGDLIIRRSGG